MSWRLRNLARPGGPSANCASGTHGTRRGSGTCFKWSRYGYIQGLDIRVYGLGSNLCVHYTCLRVQGFRRFRVGIYLGPKRAPAQVPGSPGLGLGRGSGLRVSSRHRKSNNKAKSVGFNNSNMFRSKLCHMHRRMIWGMKW